MRSAPRARPGRPRARASRTGTPTPADRSWASSEARVDGRGHRRAGFDRSAAGGKVDGRLAGDLDLTVLVHEGAFQIDQVGAVLLALARDLDLGDEGLARPGLLGEAHPVASEVADAHVVGDRGGEEPGREHPVAEDAR